MTARRVSLSLERKLPLLISVLLVLLAVGLTWAGYEEVRRSAELRGIERLQQLTAELARIAVRSTEQRFAALRRVAASDAVIAAMTDGADDSTVKAAAKVALEGLAVSAQDTAVVAELRTVRKARRIATRPEVAGADEPAASLFPEMSQGRAAIGEIYRLGDSAFYWAGAPVSHDGRVVGYVLQRRTFRMAANAQQWLRGLTGNNDVSIFFASDSGDVWTGLGGEALALPVVEPHDGDAPNVIRYTRADGRRYVAVHARVPNTPLRVIAEVPYAALRERPAAYLRRSVVVASMMLVLGGLAAWLLSRHITRPLRDLTVAASAISSGDYAKRAVVDRGDETGRLADAFNAMAEQVQRSHGELEHRIAETRSLATRLEEANRAKADFLATMSHELRTPLNAIGGYVDLLEMGIRGPLTPEQRHDLERVRHNHRHLLTLIGNILDFARLDAQKLSYDLGDVRVDRAVVGVLTAIEPLLDEKGLDRACVGCDQALVARADRARLEQILLNLLSNAVRFTPRGGAVTVTVAPRGEMVEVTVDDTGIGIPDDKLDAIFEPFVQIESGLTRTVGGTGLGLTISRELARAMGGELTGQNLARGGARFTLTLPAADAEQVALEGELSGMAEG